MKKPTQIRLDDRDRENVATIQGMLAISTLAGVIRFALSFTAEYGRTHIKPATKRGSTRKKFL